MKPYIRATHHVDGRGWDREKYIIIFVQDWYLWGSYSVILQVTNPDQTTIMYNLISSFTVNPSLAEHDMPCLSKQCRARSVSFFRSKSALFVIKYMNSYQKPASRNLTGWKLGVGEAS